MPNNNPNGKGGFQDHPELINKDGRPKEPSITRIIKEKLKEYVDKDNEKRLDDIIGEGIVKRAMEILAKPVNNWSASETKVIFEVWHSIDGMPKQKTELAGFDGQPIKTILEIVDKQANND